MRYVISNSTASRYTVFATEQTRPGSDHSPKLVEAEQLFCDNGDHRSTVLRAITWAVDDAIKRGCLCSSEIVMNCYTEHYFRRKRE